VGSRVCCPRCHGLGYRPGLDYYPEGCATCASSGYLELPLRFTTCLRDTVVGHSSLAAYYNGEAIPEIVQRQPRRGIPVSFVEMLGRRDRR